MTDQAVRGVETFVLYRATDGGRYHRLLHCAGYTPADCCVEVWGGNRDLSDLTLHRLAEVSDPSELCRECAGDLREYVPTVCHQNRVPESDGDPNVARVQGGDSRDE